jgi:membrane protease YdiL (CAAX protease family)
MTGADTTFTKYGRLLHGFTFLLVLSGTTSIPALAHWPWPWLAPWLAPIIGYFLLVLCVPELRSTFSWFRLGKLTWRTAGLTMVATAATVIVLCSLSQPHFPGSLADTLPFRSVCGLFISCALFATINATVQELVFRGLLYDSLDSVWGRWAAVLVSATVFGLSHLPVMPPGFTGILGASAAADLGVVLALLRLWSGGLALPILVHIAADATIIYRSIHAGGG